MFVSSLGVNGPVKIISYLTLRVYDTPSGFAHFRFSTLPVFGHRISCHDTGSIVPPNIILAIHSFGYIPPRHEPASLVANMTPRSFRAVVM